MSKEEIEAFKKTLDGTYTLDPAIIPYVRELADDLRAEGNPDRSLESFLTKQAGGKSFRAKSS